MSPKYHGKNKDRGGRERGGEGEKGKKGEEGEGRREEGGGGSILESVVDTHEQGGDFFVKVL